MHADVDDHPGGPETLGIKHSHPVAGIVEPAQLGHQTLGVERPALAVPGNPAAQPAPPVELIGEHHRPPDLQMVPGDTFVEHRRRLLPRMEGVDAGGNRPPHPARAGQVLGGAGVVDATGVRRCDAAFQVAQRFGDVEVVVGQRIHRAVGQILHPLLESIGAMDEVARLAIESSQCLGGGRTRIEPMGDRVLLGDNAVQLLQPPVVRLVQVDDRSEEGSRIHLVRVAPAGVDVARVRADVLAEHLDQRGVGIGRALGARSQFLAQGVVSRSGIGDHRDEQALDLARLLDTPSYLAGGGRSPCRRRGTQRVGVSRDPLRDLGQPAAEHRPVVFGVGGHQVEDVAHGLQR